MSKRPAETELPRPEPTGQITVGHCILAVASATLSLAAYVGGGNITPISIRLLLATSIIVVAGVLLRTTRVWHRAIAGGHAIMLACMAACFAALIWSPIDFPMDTLGVGGLQLLMILLGVAAVLSGGIYGKGLGRWTVPALILIQGILLTLFVVRLRWPGIDVLMFQQMSCDALLQGVNPYAIKFPDPYPPQSSAMFYGPGVSVNGILQFGFPYMPLSLLLSFPGFLAGDVRYSAIACVLVAATLIALAQRGDSTKAALVLLTFSPIAFLVVVLGWTESLVVVLLAFVVWAHARKPWLLPYAFGLLLVSKQYMLGLAPLGLLLLPRPWSVKAVVAFAWRAAIPAAIVTLPLVLWDFRAFWDSAIALQARQPYRPDALSFLVWANPADPSKWLWLPFAGLLLSMSACLLVGWKRAMSFPFAVAVCLLVFFAFNKQAFANYYYLVIGALCCALAAEGSDDVSVESKAAAKSRMARGAA